MMTCMPLALAVMRRREESQGETPTLNRASARDIHSTSALAAAALEQVQKGLSAGPSGCRAVAGCLPWAVPAEIQAATAVAVPVAVDVANRPITPKARTQVVRDSPPPASAAPVCD